MTRKFTPAEIRAAIKGSGGITKTVASRLDCEWSTARRHIDKFVTTRRAWEDEQESTLDMCEAVLLKSIQEGDTADAKWMLARLRKDKYAPRQEVTGAGGDDLIIKVTMKAED